ncbi:MAG TPA: MoxR family ATPase [Chloroflexota bacterium]|jgi:MoxR-like ATPase|nr:MoxR family ATPase [Chloroflexota bacterium]
MTPQEFYDAATRQVRRVLVEAEDTFRLLLAASLVDGHVLVEGVPGTAKTLMARVLAHLLIGDPEAARHDGQAYAARSSGAGGPAEWGNGAEAELGAPRRFQRIQFTPDLMPSDILGTTIFNSASATFSFRPGPIFANVVVADEVNRAPAKTQSALLEAMEERQVTVEGRRLPLPPLFMVVATQNPVEFEGTYPLPEAQLDRFLFKVLVSYASAQAEREIVLLHHRGFRMSDIGAAGIESIADEATLLDVRAQVAAVRLDDSVAGYIVEIERATRTAPEVQTGSSVRGAIGLMAAGKALAAFAGREYVTPDDVKLAAPPVLRHRMILRPEAELDGVTADDVIRRILGNITVPR